MREPLERWLSGFYFNKQTHGIPYRKISPDEFDREVRRCLLEVKTHNQYNFRVWASMYGGQLEGWLERFQAKQFVFAPMRAYFGEETRETLGAVGDRVGFPLRRGKFARE